MAQPYCKGSERGIEYHSRSVTDGAEFYCVICGTPITVTILHTPDRPQVCARCGARYVGEQDEAGQFIALLPARRKLAVMPARA